MVDVAVKKLFGSFLQLQLVSRDAAVDLGLFGADDLLSVSHGQFTFTLFYRRRGSSFPASVCSN